MRKEEKETCQVCFVKPYHLFDYSSIIRCITCGASCHKSCYCPSSTESKFECDSCRYNPKGKEACFICGNFGLLKKVEDEYAHPICLLFSINAIVLEYSTLTFSLIKNPKKDRNQKKSKCSICSKTGELEKCYAECSNEVHMFCAWKSYQEDNGWNHNTIVENLEYSEFFENKANLFLKPIGEPITLMIDSFTSKIKRYKLRQFELACPNHIDTIFECCTQEKYFEEAQIDYTQCDQCFRWYHNGCLDQSKSKEIFICAYCQNFWKIINLNSNSEIYLKRFPRLNICELIYLQYLFEKKNYELTKMEAKFLFSMPIEPSIIFVENYIKKNIVSRLKVEKSFKSLCKLNLNLRIDKKQFKDKFKRKYEDILALITETKSLYELREEHTKSEEIKSESNVENEEREKITKWILILDKFRSNYKDFNEVVTQLIKKLTNWLKSLSKEEEDTVKSFDEESYNVSATGSESVKVESHQTGEVKVNEMSSEEESEMKEVESESESRNQFDEKPEVKLPRKVEIKNRNRILEEEKENFAYGDQNLEKQILESINSIRKNINNKKINKEKLTLKVLNQHQDKIFFLETILNENLPSKSTLKLFLLEALLKTIFEIIEQHANLENNLNQDQNEAQTTFSGEIQNQSKNEFQNNLKKKIMFVERFRDKIFEIYYSLENELRKNFKKKIEFLEKSANDLIDMLHIEKVEDSPKQLSFDETLKKIMKCPNPKGISDLLKSQIKESFNENELTLLRLQIEKKKIYVSLKNIEFTRLSSSDIGRMYQSYCKSSSSEKSEESEEKKPSLKRKLRNEILGLQKKSIEQWIKIFGLTFDLANGLSALEDKNDEDDSMVESKQSFVDKEPLIIINEYLSMNYVEKEELQKSVFSLILLFFVKMKESLINYKIFHTNFVATVDKLAKFCINFSLFNVGYWAEDELSLSTMRYLYKTYHKFYCINKKSIESERFNKVWKIFETDELYSGYMEEHKELIFRDPEMTEEIFKCKIPEMLTFYQENELICRVKQLRRIRLWINYYFRSLYFVGPENLVDEKYLTEKIKKKYENENKMSFNQLAILISELHRVKFPQCTFTKRIIDIFNKATAVESEIQSFFDKSSFYLEESYALKEEFLSENNIEKHCVNFKDQIVDEKKQRMSSAEYKTLMNLIENNEVSKIITYELEKFTILDERNHFKRCAVNIENIIKSNNEEISIKELNLMYFEILSCPFHYVNLKVFHLFIAKRVERQQIYGNITAAKNKQKEKEFVSVFEKLYGELLSELESNSKMMCRTLTRDQVIKKIQQISGQEGYKNAEKNQTILKLKKLINEKIERFDKIKNSMSKLLEKINLNKTLEHQEIEELDCYISTYKTQKIYEFTFEILSSNLEQYKLAFSPIPDDSVQKLIVFEQLKSLKKPFKTKELLRKIYELEKYIGEY